MVEKFGVAGWVAGGAEIVHAANQPRAEQPVPNAVGHHPRGEWVIGVGDPLCQLQSAALSRRNARRRNGDHLQRPAGHHGAKAAHLAADMDPGIGDLFPLAHAHGSGALGAPGFQFVQLAAQGGQLIFARGGGGSLFVGGDEHHRIGRDMSGSSLVRHDHMADIRLELEFTQGDIPPIDRRCGFHGDLLLHLALGAEDGDRRRIGAAVAMRVGQPDRVPAGGKLPGLEGDGLGTFALVLVVRVTLAQVGAAMG